MPALSDEGLAELARAVIEAEGRAVHGMARAIDSGFVRAARAIASATGKILITGSGTSGTIAARAAHLMSVCGTPAFYLSPGDGLHGGLGVLQPQDLVIALSKGGSSEELNTFCSRARPLCAGVIAITAAPASALAVLADHVICFSLDDDADLGSVVATGSSLAISALLDALAEIGRVSRDYDWQRLLYTHPSGAVGRDAATSLQRLAGAPTKG
ncbi:SIS domain-containing protein [Labrys monachus]|uniref:Arabinose-5-phosphate isomerase n=1 Tax=Labrys monachus TaxID=217067 RepID=A0ABU0FDN1_9HYPH|nr:SIS domain-containing protein [Labrys monachus]MDQ0392695.1 arabinose-5-phosphate isomerase [Labrys monachus]